jgi:hypothetical protein
MIEYEARFGRCVLSSFQMATPVSTNDREIQMLAKTLQSVYQNDLHGFSKSVSFAESVHRTAYFNEPCVAGFTEYLVALVRGEVVLNFQYDYRGSTTMPEHLRRCGQAATLESMTDFYGWANQGFEANDALLLDLATNLRKSVLIEPSATVTRELLEELMNWGLPPAQAAHNMRWAHEQGESLPFLLREGLVMLRSGEWCGSVRVKLNSGYAKVFSLLDDAIAMYDGRFGAGICFLVRRYLESIGVALVPEPLAFRWHQGKSKSRRRDPGWGSYRFARLYTAKPWAQCISRTSWILEQARDASQKDWCSDAKGLRKLGAAIFAIGYELPM